MVCSGVNATCFLQSEYALRLGERTDTLAPKQINLEDMSDFVGFCNKIITDNHGYLCLRNVEFLRNLPAVMPIENHSSIIEFNRDLDATRLDIALERFAFLGAQRLKKLVGITLLGCDDHSSPSPHG